MDSGAVRRLFSRLRERAGIEKRCHPHGMRHTHANELVREGVPMNVVQRQLGHNSLSTTERYLQGLTPQDVIDTMRSRSWTETQGATPCTGLPRN